MMHSVVIPHSTKVDFSNKYFRGFRSTGGQNLRFPVDFSGHHYNSAAATTHSVTV